MIIEETVPHKIWRVSHDLAEDGQVAVFDEASSDLVLFNEFGGLVWNEIDGVKSVDAIVSSLSQLPLAVPPRAEIFVQVKVFLSDLLERGAISVS